MLTVGCDCRAGLSVNILRELCSKLVILCTSIWGYIWLFGAVQFISVEIYFSGDLSQVSVYVFFSDVVSYRLL